MDFSEKGCQLIIMIEIGKKLKKNAKMQKKVGGLEPLTNVS